MLESVGNSRMSGSIGRLWDWCGNFWTVYGGWWGQGAKSTPREGVWESHLSLTAASTSFGYTSSEARVHTQDYFTSLQNCPLWFLVLCRADAMGSVSVPEAVWQRWGIFLLQKPKTIFSISCSENNAVEVRLYKVKLKALERFYCRVYGPSPSYP